MNEEVFKIAKEFNENIPKKYWKTLSLTGADHDFIRSKPAPYLKTAIRIAKTLNMKNVVEIGSTRFALSQKCLDYYNSKNIDPFISPPCCADGHGGIIWAIEGFQVYSCDIDPHTKTQAIWSFENIKKEFPNNLHLNIPKDGIEFLKEFEKTIDVLFLDGWDTGTDLYREKHLECFETAKEKLAETHLILIDDTDFDIKGVGKDAFLSPKLLELGYKLLFNGRQKLYINK
jgi:hypothetical protein